MPYVYIFVTLLIIVATGAISSVSESASIQEVINDAEPPSVSLLSEGGQLEQIVEPETLLEEEEKEEESETESKREEEKDSLSINSSVPDVPFYSQFSDISAPQWQKVGCGIAAVAMLVNFYEPESVTPDVLLERGIAANAFLPDAGWTHQGLINLTKPYGLNGESHDIRHLGKEGAFAHLNEVLKEGPVMVSVHYTFEPTNPIPHLVVVTGVTDELVYYNDPAEPSGGGSISIKKFMNAWKDRYIEIRPV